MQLQILTPEREVYSGEVDFVSGMSEEGSFGMLAGHLPSLMKLRPAPLKIVQKDSEMHFAVYEGFLSKEQEDLITVFSKEAKAEGDLDETSTRERIQRLEKELASKELPEGERKSLEWDLQRSKVDLSVAKHG